MLRCLTLCTLNTCLKCNDDDDEDNNNNNHNNNSTFAVRTWSLLRKLLSLPDKDTRNSMRDSKQTQKNFKSNLPM